MADATYQSKVYRDSGGDRQVIAPGGELLIEGAVLGATPVQSYFVDTVNGDDDNDGKSWSNAFATMAAALAVVTSYGKVYFVGDVREELIGSNLLFDVSIIGCGNKPHHPDLPAAGYTSGAAAWRPPASPTSVTPLLTLRGRGWRFENILFDAPVDAAAVLLVRNALSGESEYDSSHAAFVGCRFDAGQSGIENDGGASFVLVEDCDFRGLTNAIKCLSTSVAMPLRWMIRGNTFVDNTNHVLSSFSRAVIRDNVFGKFTTEALNTIYNSTQGEYNVVFRNAFSGDYDTAEGYTADTLDTWVGNYAPLTTGVASAAGAINVLPTT